ncbi:MAG: GAF domain-containing protein, partial [Anaerolineaceae bacterium]|nr:GAF domain-containing protein [Anaerolineaceae bacterium]
MQIVFDQLNDAVFIYDQTGEILLANQSASRLIGVEPSEIIGKSIEAFVLLQTRLSEEKNRFLEYDQSSSCEYPKFQTEILTNDGQKVKVEVNYLPLSNNTKPLTCLIVKNISEHSISTTLREINSTLSSSLSLVEVFDLLLVELRKLIRYDGGNIMKIGDNMASITRTLGYETFIETLPNFLYSLHFDIESTQNLKTITNQKKPLIIHNTQQTPYWIHNEVSDLFRSWIGVPIIIDNKVNAIISLDKVEPNYFTEEHAIILTNFANQAASAIRNAKFFKEATRAANRFMTLYQLSQIISTNIRTADIYPSIHQAVSELMETEFFGIALYDSSAQTITDVYMNDSGQPQKLTSRPLEKGLFASVLKSGDSLIFNTFDSAKAEELDAVIMGDDADPEISQSILVV